MPKNEEIQKHIDSSSDLVTKMNALTAKLQENVIDGFRQDFGRDIPSVDDALVLQLSYTMVYSTDPIVSNYLKGAQDILDAALGDDWAVVTKHAMTLVGTLLDNIVGAGKVQTGVEANSARIEGPQGKEVIAAVRTEAQVCQATSWATQSDFYVASYVFVLWEPKPEHLQAYVARLGDRLPLLS